MRKTGSSKRRAIVTATALSTLLVATASMAGSRILGTGAVSAIEGAAGGGLSPWAVLSSTASDDEIGVTAAATRAWVDDYRLTVTSASLNLHDRMEFSIARQSFELSTLGGELEQNIYGAKVRLFGDVLYHPLGIWSAGVMHKRLVDGSVPTALGADDVNGTDTYLSASKLLFNAFLGRNVLINGTLRNTSANQGGLLGFGGDQGGHAWMAEGSVGVFVTPNWIVGTEYRQKPDNLSVAEEEDWQSVYSAYFFNKHVSLTGAWLDLGDIAGLPSQRGGYLSLQAAF
ncbi:MULTISPECIES: DUF3034 family protein [unclassified Halomonas]|jgi:hypothetical protein|uniref:DUF3034 family protein n=1 Tax=unclassified Halomonas TaxID=2609666 RepID=UPI001118C39D|nr:MULTISPECIES: DUF3034 family protein [unclassified Halomonas]MCG7575447.1 DUF3034 family protein [Halomonas sp. MMH1-48]MCG7602509.1 DUF3034 family protein [Halomonas sp. MM17-34]MCG7611733.1 DUF3034 family protein [Halomonas sp. MM17-29]MCG7618614.1 DUF3034 family protein [Halomonas sp. DSH1-27]TNH15822.1 DUF3034 family protein [Halomonas sp. BL6]